MPRIFEYKHTEEVIDNPNALVTVTISGLTFEEYLRLLKVYTKEFDDFWNTIHLKPLPKVDTSS